MSNNKQSSVELFIEQLEEKGDLRDCESIGLIQLNIDKNEYLALKKQAKAMHEYEIENAYDEGWQNNNDDRYNPITYYNKTFGGNNDK